MGKRIRIRDEEDLLLELRKLLRDLKGVDYVIVEGKRDKNLLLKLGLKNVLTLREAKKLELGGKRIAILTDFDEKGEEIGAKLKEELIKRNAKIDEHCRRLARILLKSSSVNQIEAMKKLANLYLSRWKRGI